MLAPSPAVFLTNVKFVTSLRGTPPTGIRLQYATQNHVGVVQSFLDPGVTNDDATMIASWSYNGSTAIMVGPIDPTYGTLQAQINLGMTLDSLEPGTSFYEPDELMHIFDLGLPMWNRLSYIPVTLSVALQYNYPCAIENRSKIFASGLFGPMTLRYYLSKVRLRTFFTDKHEAGRKRHPRLSDERRRISDLGFGTLGLFRAVAELVSVQFARFARSHLNPYGGNGLSDSHTGEKLHQRIADNGYVGDRPDAHPGSRRRRFCV